MNTEASKDVGLEINIRKNCYNQYVFMTDPIEYRTIIMYSGKTVTNESDQSM
jgi:hypothetical protein